MDALYTIVKLNILVDLNLIRTGIYIWFLERTRSYFQIYDHVYYEIYIFLCSVKITVFYASKTTNVQVQRRVHGFCSWAINESNLP